MVEEWDFSFAGLIVEEGAAEWQLRYAFYGEGEAGWVHVLVSAPLAENVFPSVVEWIHAADWHEREAEDLFGVRFEGHPHLGDFVLHNDAWQEGVEPMRHGFDAQAALRNRLPDADWRPRRIVQEPGAFVMPIGPKFSGVTESVHFLLETVGEDVIRSSTRLFYKWRAVEKLAEGKTVEEVLLLAERFAATTAFAHGLAFCPGRRVDRRRASAAARARAARVSGRTRAAAAARRRDPGNLRIDGAGRRHQSGGNSRGGAAARLGRTDGSSLPVRPARAGRAAAAICRPRPAAGRSSRSQNILKRLNELERRLSISSSFLDRIEEVGVIPAATREGLQSGRAGGARVGTRPRFAPRRSRIPVTRRSISTYRPNRKAMATRDFGCCSPRARQSVRIMEQAVGGLDGRRVFAGRCIPTGAALGWVEAPRGATFHWVRLDEAGRIARYRDRSRRRSPTGTASTSPRRNSRSRIFPSFSRRSICPWPRTTDDNDKRADNV